VTDAAATAATRLEAAGQGHLLGHAARLPPVARAAFLAEAAAVAWDRVARAFAGDAPPAPPTLRPPDALTLRRQRNEPRFAARLAEAGLALLGDGRVAFLLLAGGQGTRLGHPGPKGTFVLGPTPDRTLFAILAERVAAAGRRAGRAAPLVVLVSRDTEAATRAAFADPGAWGVAAGDLRFVRQAELPALDFEGRALVAAEGRLATAPDGHGGAVEALRASGTLAWLSERGCDTLVTFQVDNPLGRPTDPVFLGWMRERGAVAGGKAVHKASPGEKVGVFARDVDGRLRVVEYSELPPGGAPELVLGSIAVNAFSVPWLRSVVEAPGFALPYHRARKKVAHLDGAGRRVEPAEPNAVKFEQFLFDLFPIAPRTFVHEVDRRREFAPIKNADGEDSPATARAAVAAEVVRWHRDAGVPPPEDPLVLRPLLADGPEDVRRGAEAGSP
jgi:UDP-N-acetylglucosamine/UDP-N-acetylgalactosamine diphosphorylase